MRYPRADSRLISDSGTRGILLVYIGTGTLSGGTLLTLHRFLSWSWVNMWLYFLGKSVKKVSNIIIGTVYKYLSIDTTGQSKNKNINFLRYLIIYQINMGVLNWTQHPVCRPFSGQQTDPSGQHLTSIFLWSQQQNSLCLQHWEGYDVIVTVAHARDVTVPWS